MSSRGERLLLLYVVFELLAQPPNRPSSPGPRRWAVDVCARSSAI